MKLYMHPVSNASRPVRLFIAEKKIACEEQLIDLMTGEHTKPPYAVINPSKLVPTLEDGDFRLTESATILRYLAGKEQLPEYPTELRERAKVDELLDWFNTQFYRDFGYGLAYPQIFPGHKRPTDDLNAAVVTWGQERAKGWLDVLDKHWLAGGPSYLRGDQITIADYFASSFVSLAEFIRADFSPYPNLRSWYERMKGLKTWNKVHEVFYGFAGSMKDAKFEVV